jgi:hypothetical protein
VGLALLLLLPLLPMLPLPAAGPPGGCSTVRRALPPGTTWMGSQLALVGDSSSHTMVAALCSLLCTHGGVGGWGGGAAAVDVGCEESVALCTAQAAGVAACRTVCAAHNFHAAHHAVGGDVRVQGGVQGVRVCALEVARRVDDLHARLRLLLDALQLAPAHAQQQALQLHSRTCMPRAQPEYACAAC